MTMFKKVLEKCNSVQHLYSAGVHSNIVPEKMEAKRIGLEMLGNALPKNVSTLVVDIGGEDFYQKFLPNSVITKWNLPNDMHDHIETNWYDGAIAMHVLEHSPCPLLVLHNIHECLKEKGFLYIAVPTTFWYFERDFPDHLTMMSATMWKKLIELSGFEILSHTNGKFNPDPVWIEERFLCRKKSI